MKRKLIQPGQAIFPNADRAGMTGNKKSAKGETPLQRDGEGLKRGGGDGKPVSRLSTGIPGLDEILNGGLIPRRSYMVRGGPGTGKTTMGLHFLQAGLALGERTLFITIEEPEANIRKSAAALGLDLKGVTFLDLSPTSEFFAKEQTYDIFSPAEVEREPTTQKIIAHIENIRPHRVFLEVMTEFRYLSSEPFQFRKQALSFLHFLVEKGATVLLTSEGSASGPDDDLQFMVDGVIHLRFENGNRDISVVKFRGSDFRSGRHSMRLTGKGMEVYPRIQAEMHARKFVPDILPSGVPELDELLCGGLERGTFTIITGPTGVGKTTLGLQFMKEAAGRGERSVVYTFEEWRETLLRRAQAIHIPVHSMIKRGTLSVVQVEPLRYSPDEFAQLVRHEVEQKEASIVMIDSAAGYAMSMKGPDLVGQLHLLSKYLTNMGVTVLLINEVESIIGEEFRATEIGVSFLADNVVFLRYLEIQGEIRKAIGVLKKRVSDFQKSLRELTITSDGIKVGQPLRRLRGVLTGEPQISPPGTG